MLLLAIQRPRLAVAELLSLGGLSVAQPCAIAQFCQTRLMDYDRSKVDEMTLALMYLTSFTEHGITRSWKGYDWDALGRLHAAGLLSDPVGKAKSVCLTDAGEKRLRELFERYFEKSA